MRAAWIAWFLSAAGALAAETLPPALAEAGIDERLGATVDGSLSFRDEAGKETALREYLGRGKPLLLNFAYFRCPMLCGMVQEGMAKGLGKLAWLPGGEYEILTVGMDWREGPAEAAEAKRARIASWKPEAGAGWHFLTGERKPVEGLAERVGFGFNYLPAQNEFAHGAGLIFLSPAGVVSRYLYGIDFSPRDLRLALLDASEGRPLSIGEKIAMFCYRYDANAKGSVLFARNFMKA